MMIFSLSPQIAQMLTKCTFLLNNDKQKNLRDRRNLLNRANAHMYHFPAKVLTYYGRVLKLLKRNRNKDISCKISIFCKGLKSLVGP